MNILERNEKIMKEILGPEELGVTTIRDKITGILGAEMFATIMKLGDELEEQDMNRVTTEEFMVAVEGVLCGINLYDDEEEDT